ncbi:MAG: hypothetical protein M3483_07290 [Gemmatimonadota bacterium]|nr:hypothetical protein [Gemmatimonadota bacterium]
MRQDPSARGQRAPLVVLVGAVCACAPAPPLSTPSPDTSAVTAPEAASAPAPGSEIYLAPLVRRGGRIDIGATVNITRRPGYDNQPSFTPDGAAVLFTSRREDGQADIYRFDIASGVTTRVTTTPESEYSPTMTPSGEGISVVRVEADSTQRLWEFPVGGGDPSLILPEVRPVGYHAWLDAGTLALFVLGSPPTLQVAERVSGRAEVAAANIGRSLHRVPGRGTASYVDKGDAEEWWIVELDPLTRRNTRLVRTLPDVEDYTWTPWGEILMARGSTIFRWSPGAVGWEAVADLAGPDIAAITRLAVSPAGDRLALVVAEP